MTEYGITAPIEVDDYSDEPDGFIQEWWVTPPRKGETYRVVHEVWHPWGTTLVRRIYEWQPAPARRGVSPIHYARLPRWRRRLARLISLFTGDAG